ncbi:TPA: hypothetical protein ACHKET_003912 [Acinetobacter baumannii]|uniref:hypothetical protein n=1 Tax=Gammaproteobacteria TaxID=1236 RepID=UPI001E651B70|nr:MULTISPECIES: hypothetical protein [Gammaproteobacteria]MDF7765897.1 hypothetical protein [Acinetobacter baumannii]HCQ9669165.1 hypothetical protein [Acinetobacter baumannii]
MAGIVGIGMGGMFMQEYADLSNYAALHQALRILDDKNINRLADKLGVSISDLETTLFVLNKI